MNIIKIWVLALVSILIVIFISPTIAQDDIPRIEDLLRWFPLGDYDLIFHLDREMIQEADTFQLYRDLFKPYETRADVSLNLPYILRKGILSSTTAQLLRIKVAVFPDEQEAGEYEAKYGDMLTVDEIGGRYYTFESVGDRLTVLRFSFLEDNISEALKSGYLQDTGLKIFERPVYALFVREKDEMLRLFSYATNTQELLLSPSIDHLRRMIYSGRGVFLSLLDGREYMDLVEVSDDLGQFWQYISYAAHDRLRLARMRNSGVRLWKLEALKQKMLEGETSLIVTRYLDQGITLREIAHFDNTWRAEDWLEQNRLTQNVGIMTPEFLKRNLSLYFQYRKFERQERMVISTVRYEGTVIADLWEEYEKLLEFDELKNEIDEIDPQTERGRGLPSRRQ